VRGLSIREDEETVRGADEDVVPETFEEAAEDAAHGDVDEEMKAVVVLGLLVFVLRLAEQYPVSRAERELVCRAPLPSLGGLAMAARQPVQTALMST
jgi:hypothetical protein